MDRSSARWIYVISAGLAAVAIGGAVALRDVEPYGLEPLLPWWLVLPIAFLLERTVFHVEFRTEAITFSVVEIVLVAGVFFSDPLPFAIAVVAGRGIALLSSPLRRIPIKVAFNLALFALSPIVTLTVFRALAPEDSSVGPDAWVALFAGVLLSSTVDGVALSSVVAIAERRGSHFVPRQLAMLVGVDVVNASLALVGTIAFAHEPFSILFLVPPLGMLVAAYRVYVRQRENHRRLLELYEASRALQDEHELDGVLRTALQHAREMFRGATAVAVLLPDERSGTGLRAEASMDGAFALTRDQSAAEACIELLPKLAHGAALIEDASGDPLLTACVGRQVRDAVVAPLQLTGAPAGVLVVADRRGTVGSFADVDLPVLEALASAAASAAGAARLLGRLRVSLTEAVELARVKDLFVATVSHELRTPLTSIEGYVRTLMRTDVTLREEDRAMCLDGILRQSERLGSIVEDMLTVTGLVSGDVKPRLSPVSASAVAQSIAARWTADGKTVVDAGEQGAGMIVSDATIIARVLDALLDNAFKFSPPGSTVEIGARDENGGARFWVRDEGPGIEVHARDSIFESFYQADASATRTAGGMGLGLYIARRLTEALGGRIWLERTGPEGSVFSVWVPSADQTRPLARAGRGLDA